MWLRESFVERYIVQRTNEAEIRPEEQSQIKESCREHGMKYSPKGHIDRNRQEQNKEEWASSVGLCRT